MVQKVGDLVDDVLSVRDELAGHPVGVELEPVGYPVVAWPVYLDGYSELQQH